MNKREKTAVVVLITICLFIVIYLGVFFNNNSSSTQKTFDKKYLVLDNYANLAYFNNDWKTTTINEIEQYKSNYQVYSKNQYLGKFNLKYGNVWNLFDNNDEYVNYEGDSLFAYSNNFIINKQNIDIRNINEKDQEDIINNFNYKDFNDIVSNDAIDYDLDDNGIIDKIICISNMGENKNNKDNYYNLVYLKINNKIIQIINENSSNYDILKAGIYNLSYLFNTKTHKYLVIKKTTGIISDCPEEDILMYDYTDINHIKKVKIG